MDYYDHVTFEGFSDPDKDRTVLKDKGGRFRTNLFFEFNSSVHHDQPPLYTMRELPYSGLPSAYLIYMTSDSEYEAAMKLVGSWTHWQKLCTSRPFMEGEKSASWSGLNAWREEKAVKDAAIAYNQLKMSAASGNVVAQKIVYEGDKDKKRGRPSKAEVQQAAKEQAALTEQMKDDFKRITLAVNNDDKQQA
jgi:hypothetical protein